MTETGEVAFQAMRNLWFASNGLLSRAIEAGLADVGQHGVKYTTDEGLEIRKTGDCLGLSYDLDGASEGDVSIEIEYGPDIRDFPRAFKDFWSGRWERKTVKRSDFVHIARQATARLVEVEVPQTANA